MFSTSFISCKMTEKTALKNAEYYPLSKGNTWTYQYADSPNKLIVKIIDEEIEITGKKYFKVQRTYSWGEQNIDYSRNEQGVLYSYNYKSGGESIVIPKQLNVGYRWINYDKSWEYEIIGINESLKTPTNNYKDLLKIKATQLTNRDKSKRGEYMLYFKKGIGQIAAEGNGQLMTFLTKTKIK